MQFPSLLVTAVKLTMKPIHYRYKRPRTILHFDLLMRFRADLFNGMFFLNIRNKLADIRMFAGFVMIQGSAVSHWKN